MKALYDRTAEELSNMKRVYIVTSKRGRIQGKSAFLNYDDALNSIEKRAIETQSTPGDWYIEDFYLLGD